MILNILIYCGTIVGPNYGHKGGNSDRPWTIRFLSELTEGYTQLALNIETPLGIRYAAVAIGICDIFSTRISRTAYIYPQSKMG